MPPTHAHAHASADTPIVVDTLLEHCLGSTTVARTVLDRLATQLAEAERALRTDRVNPGELGRIAHRLRGSATVVGATAMYEAATTLEQAASAHVDPTSAGPDACGPAADRLLAEVRRCAACIDAARHALAHAPAATGHDPSGV